jgi:cytochrome c553
VKTRAAELKKLFGDVQEVFKGLNLMTAMLYASDAIKQADAAAAAATAGKWEDVTAASAALGQACTTCHTAHRERMDDGTFRLKK